MTRIKPKPDHPWYGGAKQRLGEKDVDKEQRRKKRQAKNYFKAETDGEGFTEWYA